MGGLFQNKVRKFMRKFRGFVDTALLALATSTSIRRSYARAQRRGAQPRPPSDLPTRRDGRAQPMLLLPTLKMTVTTTILLYDARSDAWVAQKDARPTANIALATIAQDLRREVATGIHPPPMGRTQRTLERRDKHPRRRPSCYR